MGHALGSWMPRTKNAWFMCTGRCLAFVSRGGDRPQRLSTENAQQSEKPVRAKHLPTVSRCALSSLLGALPLGSTVQMQDLPLIPGSLPQCHHAVMPVMCSKPLLVPPLTEKEANRSTHIQALGLFFWARY